MREGPFEKRPVQKTKTEKQNQMPEMATQNTFSETSPKIITKEELLSSFGKFSKIVDRYFRLTPQQKKVLFLSLQGYSYAKMADEMEISESSICQHIYASYVELGVRNRKDACTILCGGEIEEENKRIKESINEDEKKILALLAQGYNVREISTLLDTPFQTIRSRLKGVRRKISLEGGEDQRARLLRAARNRNILPEDENLPLVKTREEIGRDIMEIRKIIHGMNLLRLLATETFFMSYAEIGEILGISETSVGEKTLEILKIFGYEAKEKRREGRLFLKSLLQHGFITPMNEEVINKQKEMGPKLREILRKIKPEKEFKNMKALESFLDIRVEDLLPILEQARNEGKITITRDKNSFIIKVSKL